MDGGSKSALVPSWVDKAGKKTLLRARASYFMSPTKQLTNKFRVGNGRASKLFYRGMKSRLVMAEGKKFGYHRVDVSDMGSCAQRCAPDGKLAGDVKLGACLREFQWR